MVSSTESAITSRDGSEDFMPSCPMAMPSVTVMVQNSRGVPPAAATPFFTACAWRISAMLQGAASFQQRRDADERLMDLRPRQPHRVVVGAMRRALGTLGHVAAGQPGLEIGLGVHWFAFILISVTFARPPVDLGAAYGQIAARPAGFPSRMSMF